MIDAAYHDVMRLVRDQVKTAGIDLNDQDIFNALVVHEVRVYGLEDAKNTKATVALLRKRTSYVFDALAAPWIGTPAPDPTNPTPAFEDAAGLSIVPIGQDLQRGVWTFGDVQDRVYITGTYVDVYGAAVECLDLAMERKIEIVTQSGQQGTLNLSDIQANIARARSRLVGKMRGLPQSGQG